MIVPYHTSPSAGFKYVPKCLEIEAFLYFIGILFCFVFLFSWNFAWMGSMDEVPHEGEALGISY